MSNYIKNKLLKLPKQLKNIFITEKTINGITATIVSAVTKRYAKYYCPHCNTYHKHRSKGYKLVNYKYDVTSVGLLILSVKKIRLTCSKCNKTFTPPIDNIQPNKSISNLIRLRIATSISKNSTAKECAYNNFVSHSYAARIFNGTISSRSFDTKFKYLPSDIGFDEFKYAKGKMAFVMVAHDTDNILEVLPSRNTYKLEEYFAKYPDDVRNNVKRVTMDMYDPYMNIVKKFFPNAEIIIDKFHIIANFTKGLNKVRIDVMKQYPVSSNTYKKLKKYWRFLLKLDNSNWSYEHYSLPYFKDKITLRDAVESIVNIDDKLKLSYNFLTVFHAHLNSKNFDAVDVLYEYYKDNLPPQMLTPLNTFMKYKEYSINAYNHEISNARVESKIQKIKLIIRVAFGFRHFESLRNRLFYIQEITAIKKTNNKAIYASKFV